MSKSSNVLVVLSIALFVSSPSFASYHTDEMSGGDGSGGGYSSGSGILAVVAVGAIGYAIYKNRNQPENTSEGNGFLYSQKNEPGFKISFQNQRQKMSLIETTNLKRAHLGTDDLVSINLHYRF